MSVEQLKQRVMGKTKVEVRDEMGTPEATDRWQMEAANPSMNAQEKQAFLANQLEEIWVYRQGRISFSVSGVVKDVDDIVEPYLGPANPPMA